MMTQRQQQHLVVVVDSIVKVAGRSLKHDAPEEKRCKLFHER